MKNVSFYIIFMLLILLLQSCMKKSELEMFLIPDNYQGVVIVMFNQQDGQEEKYVDNRRVYDIPASGILLTKFPKTTHGKLNQKYYYKDILGNKKHEIEDYFSGDAEANKNYIMNGEYGQFTNELDSLNKRKYPIQYRSFTVGKIKDKDSLMKLSENFKVRL